MKGPLAEPVILWLKRGVFGFALLALLYRAWSGALLHQLVEPVLIHPHADNVYWLFHILQLPELLVGNRFVALVVDLLLFAMPVLALSFPKSTLWPRLFSLVLLLYFVTFHTFFGHHGHSLVGLLFIVVPFWFSHARTVTYALRGVRFYALFAYVSAACYKIFRGSAFDHYHLMNTLRQQNADLLWDGAQGFRQELMMDLMFSPTLLMWIGIVVVVVQLSFAIGFFTRKLDAVLIVLGALFHLGTWLTMDINFWEFTVLYFALLPGKKLQQWAGIAPKKSKDQARNTGAPSASNKASALSKHS